MSVLGARCPVAGKVDKAAMRRSGSRTVDERVSQVQGRMAQAYQEKLDGKISDEFRMQKSGGGGQRKTNLLIESYST